MFDFSEVRSLGRFGKVRSGLCLVKLKDIYDRTQIFFSSMYLNFMTLTPGETSTRVIEKELNEFPASEESHEKEYMIEGHFFKKEATSSRILL